MSKTCINISQLENRKYCQLYPCPLLVLSYVEKYQILGKEVKKALKKSGSWTIYVFSNPHLTLHLSLSNLLQVCQGTLEKAGAESILIVHFNSISGCASIHVCVLGAGGFESPQVKIHGTRCVSTPSKPRPLLLLFVLSCGNHPQFFVCLPCKAQFSFASWSGGWDSQLWLLTPQNYCVCMHFSGERDYRELQSFISFSNKSMTPKG